MRIHRLKKQATETSLWDRPLHDSRGSNILKQYSMALLSLNLASLPDECNMLGMRLIKYRHRLLLQGRKGFCCTHHADTCRQWILAKGGTVWTSAPDAITRG